MKNVAVLSIFVGSLLTITGCATKQGYVARGNQLVDAGKYEAATIEYRKAIQKDPLYGEAYYRLGLASVKQDQGVAAYQALFRAFQLMPDNVDVKEKFGQVCLAFYLADTSRPQNFYKLLNQVSDDLLSRNPNSYEGLKVKAYLAATDQKNELATQLFRRALALNSSDPAVAGALVQNLLRNGQAQEAENLALDITDRHKSYGPIYDLLYNLYSKSNRPVDAEDILKKKVSSNPKNGEFALQLAAHYAHVGKSAEMKSLLQSVLDDPKDFPQARLWVGDFYLSQRNYSEAIRNYEEGVKTVPKDKVVYQQKIANVLMFEGDLPGAERVVDDILRQNPQNRGALTVHADLLLKKGGSDNLNTAEKEFLALSKQAPDDAAVWYGLAEINRLKGDLQAAHDSYLEATKHKKDFVAAKYRLGEVALQLKLPQETLQQTEEILRVQPEDSNSHLLHVRALIATGNIAAAKAELMPLAKAAPTDVGPQLELGLAAISQKNFPEALAVFTKLQASNDPRAIAGLGETYLAQRQFEKAFQVLSEGYKRVPNSALIQEQLAKAAALTGRYDTAIAQFRELLKSDPKSIEKRLRLAETFELKGDYDNAILVYREAQRSSPSDLFSGVALAEALFKAGRTAEAGKQYQTLIKAHPDDPGTLNNAALFLSETGGSLDEALNLVQRALQRVPGQPGFSDTIGYIYLKKGQRNSAIQTFSNLVRKYPTFATYRYHLGLALLQNGDKAAARKELQTALSSNPQRDDAQKIKVLLEKIS